MNTKSFWQVLFLLTLTVLGAILGCARASNYSDVGRGQGRTDFAETNHQGGR